jgi:hypothetical protein
MLVGSQLSDPVRVETDSAIGPAGWVFRVVTVKSRKAASVRCPLCAHQMEL